MKQYPADFRERLLGAIDAGLARAKAAVDFGVSERTIQRWQHQRRETGSWVPQPRQGRPRRIGPADEPALQQQVAATPDATLAQQCAAWTATHGQSISRATMCRTLARLELTVKKNR